MINASSSFISAIGGNARTLDMKLFKGATEISCSIVSASFTKGSCGAEAFQVGGLYSQFAQIIVDELNTSLKGEEITLKIGVLIPAGTYEYIQVGKFKVMNAPRKVYAGGYRSTLECRGRLSWAFDEPFSISVSQSISNVLSRIATLTGVTIQSSAFTTTQLSNVITKDLNGLSCKEVLSIVATLLGGYATEDSGDNVVLKKYSSSSVLTVSGEDPEVAEETFEIFGIRVIVSEASEAEDEDDPEIPEVSYEEGTVNLEIVNPYCTQSTFNAMCDNLIGYEYLPATALITVADPRLEPWDSVTFNVTGVDGTVLATYTIPCMNLVYMYDGGLSLTLTAPGEIVSETEEFISPLVKQVQSVANQIATANKLIANRATIDLANITNAYVQALVAGSIDAGLIKTGTLDADRIDTDEIAATVIESEELQTDIAEIADARIGQATIKDAQIESINGNKIIDGSIVAAALSQAAVTTLSGNKVYYQATAPTGTNHKNGDTWYKTVISASDTDKKVLHIWNGTTWVPSDFDAKLLRANSITAQEIAANTITAAQIASHSISAEQLTVSDLSAIAARLGAFTLTVDGLISELNNYDVYEDVSDFMWVEDSLMLESGSMIACNSLMDDTVGSFQFEKTSDGAVITTDSSYLTDTGVYANKFRISCTNYKWNGSYVSSQASNLFDGAVQFPQYFDESYVGITLEALRTDGTLMGCVWTTPSGLLEEIIEKAGLKITVIPKAVSGNIEITANHLKYGAFEVTNLGAATVDDKPVSVEGHTHDDRYYTESEVDTELDGKLDKSGGTLTGNLTGQYITGTWLQTTESTDSGKKSHVAVLDDNGWLYKRTLAELLSDMGAAPSGHNHTASNITDMPVYIVESGTSNLWNYKKYSDGRMIATKRITTGSVLFGNDMGTYLHYTYGTSKWALPSGFIEPPIVNANYVASENGTSKKMVLAMPAEITTTDFVFTYIRFAGNVSPMAQDNMWIDCIAEGRWK